MPTLIHQKIAQAIKILEEKDIDLWLTLVSETPAGRDPVLPLIYGHDLTWLSAMILTRSGDRIAIVGNYDSEMVIRSGAYSTVLPYHQSIRPVFTGYSRTNPTSFNCN